MDRYLYFLLKKIFQIHFWFINNIPFIKNKYLGKRLGAKARLATALADKYGFTVLALKLAELWDVNTQYRYGGIWGKKLRTRLFKLDVSHEIAVDDFHAPWHSAAINKTKQISKVDIFFYHLGMITEKQRITRRDKYKKLDPNNQWQAIGYDYLTDVNWIELKTISKNELDLD